MLARCHAQRDLLICEQEFPMMTKLKIIFVIGLIATGLLAADSRWNRRCTMSFRVVDWSVHTGGHRFGISEYSLRGIGAILRGHEKPFFPSIGDSVVYLGPLGSFRATRFLIGVTACLLCLGVLLVRRDQSLVC